MTKTLLNRTVAERLNLSESGVSRLRSGRRHPSLTVMQAIERTYGWKVQEQSEALLRKDWHEEFEVTLDDYAEEHPDEDTDD